MKSPGEALLEVILYCQQVFPDYRDFHILFLVAYFFPVLFGITRVLFLAFVAAFLVDAIILYRVRKPLTGIRDCAKSSPMEMTMR